jgi:hypothetical protein
MPELPSPIETQLEDALLKAFSLESLKRMVRRSLGIVLENEFGLNRGLKYIVGDLVELSVREGWRDELIRGAIADNPNPWLKAVATTVEVPPPRPILAEPSTRHQGQLEKLVRERGVFLKWQDFTRRLSEVGRQMCRIEIPAGEAIGTGWLVASDLVLTNYHVIEDVETQKTNSQDVACRFDYFVDEIHNPGGVTCGLSENWRVDVSRYAASDTRSDAPEPTNDELDYALIRLTRPIGDEIVDGSKRGWLHVSSTPPVVLGDDILLVPQHPDGRSLELAFGKAIEFNTSGTRLRHDVNTEGGSSGSPCLSVSLAPFGLHHASGPGRKILYNQCVPLRQIIQRLQRKDIPPFWEG